MKLTHIYNKVALFAVAALSLTACNDVDEEDRFIYVEPPQTSKNVLIEDYTGQNCTNCPEATTLIHEIQTQYGEDRVIAVGIYGGDLGRGLPLATETGEYYYQKYGISSQPCGMIDRSAKVTGTSGGIGTWLTPVSEAIANSAPLEMSAVTSYDEATRTVTVDVTASGVLDVTGKLQLWLVEDNVVNIQATNSGVNRRYVHNHVFRTAVNGQDGEDITIAWDESKTVTNTYTLDESWKAEDMSVVAFVYNDSGVQQVIKVPVIPSDDAETPVEE